MGTASAIFAEAVLASGTDLLNPPEAPSQLLIEQYDSEKIAVDARDQQP